MLLVFAAVIGVLVSLASWGYLELIHYLQQWLYKDLPSGLDLSPVPTWWPLPVLAVASVPIAFAIARLPGSGGHKPAEGLKAGPPTQPSELPGRSARLARLDRIRDGPRSRGSTDRARRRPWESSPCDQPGKTLRIRYSP